MIDLIIISLCILGGGVCKGLSDRSSEDRFSNKWLNKSTSWVNKWVLNDKGVPLVVDGYRTERFLFSSRALVFLTDGWHLFNFFNYRFIDTAIITLLPLNVYWSLGCIVILPLIRYIGFKLTYKK